MARIVEHLSVAELEERYRVARDVAEARHTQAIWLLARGRGLLDVAGVLAFAPRWVEELAARYNAHGPDALGDQRRHNGRAASVLTPALLAALSGRLKAPPEDGGCWTGFKVALWMATQLGLAKVHPQRGWAEAPKGFASPKGWWKGAGGGAEAGAVVDPGAAAAASALSDTRATGRVQGGLDAAIAQAKTAHPDRPVEVWAEDEHRLGLRPIRRRVWARLAEGSVRRSRMEGKPRGLSASDRRRWATTATSGCTSQPLSSRPAARRSGSCPTA